MKSAGKMLLSALSIVLASLVGMSVAAFLLQDRMIFYPQPLSEPERAAIVHRFPATKEILLRGNDGKQLQAWLVPAAPGAPLVIYFGGNAEDASWMIPETMAHAPKLSWLLVSYPGYGASEGSPSEATIKAAALQWYDYAGRELKPSRISVFGRSLGSGAAVYLASERKVDSVVLVTPFDSLTAVARHYYPYLPVSLLLRHKFDSASRAPKIAAPLLCLAAARDEVIPSSHARKLYEAWGGEKRWIELEGAGHNSTDGVPAFWQSIEPFLKKSPA